MKVFNYVLYAMLCIIFFACRHHHGDISITYNDAEEYYSMNAYFNENQTRTLEHYMDRRLAKGNDISFINMQNDAMLTLDDHTKFYLKKTPGQIRIRLNKGENSYAAYHRIKSMCEGMKNILTK
ncbi:MAG: hypothetical protein ABIN67_23575 [Ferruginibacter sp.]